MGGVWASVAHHMLIKRGFLVVALSLGAVEDLAPVGA